MKWWKQMWCGHIWKTDKEELLRSFRIMEYIHLVGFRESDRNCYAQNQHCLKCGKERIVETEKVVV